MAFCLMSLLTNSGVTKRIAQAVDNPETMQAVFQSEQC